MEYQKTAQATGDLISDKISDVVWTEILVTQTNFFDGKITKFSKT